jgi:hypothetical protein
VIRSRRGRFLAIPTENAPRKGADGKRISPSIASARFDSCLGRAGPRCLWWTVCAPRTAGKPDSLEVSGVRQIGRRAAARV